MSRAPEGGLARRQGAKQKMIARIAKPATRGCHRPRLALAACIAAVSAVAGASPAAASVTIGQVGTPTPLVGCVDPVDWAQPTVTSGNSYVVKGPGTITSWSTMAASAAGRELKLKVFRPIAGLSYSVVGQDGPRELAPSVLNTFPTSIAVNAGDVLGLTSLDPIFSSGCFIAVPGETSYRSAGDHPNGAQVTFQPATDNLRLNVSAVFQPSNSFSFGKLKRKKKKGIAILTVNVPGPGEIGLAGPGIKPIRPGGAQASRFTSGGEVKLKIKPHKKGKKARKLRKRLRKKGKAKRKVRVTYTPAGGLSNTLKRKVKLVKKRRN